ncbi:MAG TPA: M28 family peptidase [Acidimicrobiia bacterium]
MLRNRKRLTTLLVMMMVASSIWVAPVASATSNRCERRNNNSIHKLLDCVEVDGVREHQKALQRIADRNDGTRASGTPGYDASVKYVVKKMRAAGYIVTVDPFVFDFVDVLAPSVLDQVSPTATSYVEGTDFTTMDYSGSGDVSAPVQAVDVVVPIGDNPAGTSNSGCEPEDFAGFTAGNIALMQRGTCAFADKAANAEAAGAVAAVIFNEGQPSVDGSEDRAALLFGTLGAAGFGIPVLGTTYALGETLVGLAGAAPGLTMKVFTSTLSETRETANVFAESRRGATDNIVMAGAHLDSVLAGPGINDNGSGSAALLEIAEQMAKVRPKNQVRFAWWGAEENGLLGSIDWVVRQADSGDLANVALYLNFDMIGSPNYVRFIYDGDNSDTGTPGDLPAGSGAIEGLFEKYFAKRHLPTEPTIAGDRSDHFAFAVFGVPVGGLFTGAEEIKTAEQAAVFGGRAGEALDPCYHAACDTYKNVSKRALGQMTDAAAYAIFSFAMSTKLVDEEAGAPVAPLRAAAPDLTLKKAS